MEENLELIKEIKDDKPAVLKTDGGGNNRVKKIVTVVACLLVQLCVGIMYLWSIFNAQVQYYYDWSASAANLVSSFMILGFVTGNLIGGFLQDKTNPRLISVIGCALFSGGILFTSLLTSGTIGLIYLTYSVMGGIGCGFVYGSILSCLQKWFPDRRGFASGLSVAAFGLSTVVFAPLSQFLLKKFVTVRLHIAVDGSTTIISDVPTVFRILGFTFLIVSLVCCIFISLPKTQGGALGEKNKKAALPGLTPKETLKKAQFWCIALSCFFINGLWNILIPRIKGLGLERGLDDTWAALAVTLTGIANVLGRFGTASLSDKTGREVAIIINAVITFICAVALIWVGNYVYLVIVILAAFSYGGPSATFPAMTVDIGGPRFSGTNYGFALLGLGLSSVAFNYLSVALEEATGGMTASFIVGAVAALIPVILMIIYHRIGKNSKKQAAEKQDVKT